LARVGSQPFKLKEKRYDILRAREFCCLPNNAEGRTMPKNYRIELGGQQLDAAIGIE
jgi:hypothetical protein